jgi:hypothetical protein
MLNEVPREQAEQSNPVQIKSDPAESFLWAHDLSRNAAMIVFGEGARSLYEGAEDGIRVRHLASLRREDLLYLGLIQDEITDITGFLYKMGGLTLAETVEELPKLDNFNSPAF